MHVVLHRNFDKIFIKLEKKIKTQVIEKLSLFANDAFDQTLNNHPLHGKLNGCRSININADLRAIYVMHGATAWFITIGTHSNLYR